ncbi:MAG: metal ABC transporter permease [Gammaproteobacteria bacterium]|nr:metal ABC transporter permease [Gammaproteobacteria bacterium]
MQFLYELLIEPFNYEYIRMALYAAIVIGVVCAILSCFLVLKGWSLMGDAVAHAVLPGIALAEVIGFAHPIGAFVSGFFCAISTGFIKENSRIKEDTVMGIVFSGMFALGILMIASIETDKHLMHIIKGNLLGIHHSEFIQTMVISAVVIVVMIVKWKDFMLYCFDSAHARVIGMPVRQLHYGLLTLLAMTIVASIQAVGVIMVVSLLVAPGITAYVLTKRFSRMIMIAIVVSVTASVLGTLISVHLNASTAASIVLVQSAIFTIALTLRNLVRTFKTQPGSIMSQT